MDYNLYYDLLRFRSYSRSQRQVEFRDWLRNYLETNIPGVTTKIDKFGNLYATKGEADVYNCVVAHLDINQHKIKESNVEILKVGDFIVGFDKSNGEQCGVGHDDKAGVYFNIEMLKHFDNIKAFFPLDEEVGCIGTNHAEESFFENVGFMVQLDRRGYKDISTFSNGNDLLTEKTQKKLSGTLSTFGFAFTTTILTDVGDLVGNFGIQGTNISCGYYREHSNSECLNVKQFENSIAFAKEVLTIMDGEKHTITQQPKRYNRSFSYYTDRWYDDYEWDILPPKNEEKIFLGVQSTDYITLSELLALDDVNDVEQLLWEHLTAVLEWYGEDDEILLETLYDLKKIVEKVKDKFNATELLIEYDIDYKLKQITNETNTK